MTTKEILEIASIILALLSGLAGLLGAWVIIPYRVTQLERKVDAEITARGTDHDVLIEIKAAAEFRGNQLTALNKSVDELRGFVMGKLTEAAKHG